MIDQKIANLVRVACAAGTPAEAANAAVMACRMLMKSGAVPLDSSQPASGASERSSSPFDARQYTELTGRIGALEREKRDLVAANQRLQNEIRNLKNPPVCITSRFESTCKACGERIEIGEKVWWAKGIPGVNCIGCGF